MFSPGDEAASGTAAGRSLPLLAASGWITMRAQGAGGAMVWFPRAVRDGERGGGVCELSGQGGVAVTSGCDVCASPEAEPVGGGGSRVAAAGDYGAGGGAAAAVSGGGMVVVSRDARAHDRAGAVWVSGNGGPLRVPA